MDRMIEDAAWRGYVAALSLALEHLAQSEHLYALIASVADGISRTRPPRTELQPSTYRS